MTLEDALAVVPDRGAFVARAVVVDQSAGIGDTDASGAVLDDGPEEGDLEPNAGSVRPVRRVAWDDVYPLPNVKPGRDDLSGRAWYDRLPDGQQVFGQTGDGDLIGLDAAGPYIIETNREP